MSARKDVARMLIGGTLRGAVGGDTIDAVNPATGATIGSFPRGRTADVDAAVQAASAAFAEWRTASPLERAEVVHRIADVVEAHAEELARLDVMDNGSPIREMRRDAGIAAFQLRYFAGLALELRGETVPGEHDRLNYTLRQPYGVVGRIVPFNHPLMFAAGKLGAPLVAGNTIIVKPSEHTSLSALRLGELLADVVPPGVVNVVTGYGQEAGDALVAHPGIPRLAFIGSAEVGRSIQRRAAEAAVKTVTLELGGKNPIVVLPDADLGDAVDGAIRGMNFTWQGQSCGSTSRLLVDAARRDELVERLRARLRDMRIGLPHDEATETGAIVHPKQWEKVMRHIELGHRDGARLVLGGGVPSDPALADGLFIEPTLFDGVQPDMRLAQEEIFGPVLAVMAFEDQGEARRIANGVAYGLTASVYTRDLSAALRFARDLEAGYVWINDSSKHFPGADYGGMKASGVGREEGREELASYAQIKNVNVRL